LEVSSPGIDRPLRKPRDFQRFVGENATVKSLSAGHHRSITGRIVSADDESVTLDADGEEHRIEYTDITKARLKGVIDFSTEGSAKNR
jgi:ribosome maturation factor RimP